MQYVYPQGLPLKETQANLHLAAKIFNDTKAKYPQPSCTTMPTPSTTPFTLHFPLSLEVAPCQEDS